jgi:hypothetical protein
MSRAPRIDMLFVNPKPDDESAFSRPVEERAEQIEEGTRPKKRRKILPGSPRRQNRSSSCAYRFSA